MAGRGGWLAARRTRFPLLLFTQELIALLDAGLTLTEALETRVEKEHRPESRQLIEHLLVTMREGRPFSAALADQAENFPPLYAATVRAAESTGDRSPALTRYVAEEKQQRPDDFMFQLSAGEFEHLRSQSVPSSSGGRRYERGTKHTPARGSDMEEARL